MIWEIFHPVPTKAATVFFIGTEIGDAKERSSSISLPCSSDRTMQRAHLSSLHIKHCCLSCSFVIVNGLAG